jgi:hypothetical protein
VKFSAAFGDNDGTFMPLFGRFATPVRLPKLLKTKILL